VTATDRSAGAGAPADERKRRTRHPGRESRAGAAAARARLRLVGRSADPDRPNARRSREETRADWRFIRDAVRPERRALAGSVLGALVSAGAKLAVPALVGVAVDRAISSRSLVPVLVIAGLIALAGVVQAVGAGARRWLNGVASRRTSARLREGFFAHVIELDSGFHDTINRGQLLSRVASDLFQVQEIIASTPMWLANAALSVGVGIVLLVTEPLLGAIAIIGFPVVIVLSIRFSRSIHPALAGLQRQRGQLAGVVEETVSGIRTVKGFGAEEVVRDRLAHDADGVLAESLRVVDVRARDVPRFAVVPTLGLALVNWLGGVLILQHRLTVGDLVAFNAYIAMLVGPLRGVGGYIVQAERAVVSARRLRQILERKPAIASPSRPRALPAGGGRLEAEAVTFRYPGSTTPVVADLNLRIDAGETVALVGATGSGKSTVAALLARRYDPEAGTIRLDGVPLVELDVADVRRSIATVFEENFLFDDTVRANVAVGRPDATESEIRRATTLAQATDFIERLPQGFDTVVGERGLSLSGGQRQRLALARALLAQPRVLILDDATSAIDASKEQEIVRALREFMVGRTTIVISHRPATIALADRVLLLEGGRVVAEGRHQDLLRHSTRYRQVLALGGADAAFRPTADDPATRDRTDTPALESRAS